MLPRDNKLQRGVIKGVQDGFGREHTHERTLSQEQSITTRRNDVYTRHEGPTQRTLDLRMIQCTPTHVIFLFGKRSVGETRDGRPRQTNKSTISSIYLPFLRSFVFSSSKNKPLFIHTHAHIKKRSKIMLPVGAPDEVSTLLAVPPLPTHTHNSSISPLPSPAPPS